MSANTPNPGDQARELCLSLMAGLKGFGDTLVGYLSEAQGHSAVISQKRAVVDPDQRSTSSLFRPR